MIDDRVIFNGEVFVIIAEALAESMKHDNYTELMPVVKLQKEECAHSIAYKVEFWVSVHTFYTLPSSFKWQNSDWVKGIGIGLRNGYKDNRGSNSL